MVCLDAWLAVGVLVSTYVCFAAAGSWIGAYVSMTVLRKAKGARGPEAV